MFGQTDRCSEWHSHENHIKMPKTISISFQSRSFYIFLKPSWPMEPMGMVRFEINWKITKLQVFEQTDRQTDGQTNN